MEKIFFNGDIITMDESNPSVSAILVKDGRIAKLGSDDEILRLKADKTEVIDLEGKTMSPGFIDGHSHYGIASLLSTFVQLAPSPVGAVNSIENLIQSMKDGLADFKEKNKNNPDAVFVGWGYDHNELAENRHPTKFDLDQISTEIPILVAHASGHVGAINSFFLEKEGIDSSSVNPEGGVIDRLPNSNEPSGYLEETSFMKLAFGIFAKSDKEDFATMAESGTKLYAGNGITTAQDGFPSDFDYQYYEFCAKNDKLAIDIFAYPGVIEANGWKKGDFSIGLHEKLGRMKWAGMKIFLDGSPQARTAWMSEPYEVVSKDDDPDYVAYPIYTDDQLLEGMLWCIDNNTQFLTHANGDAAADQFIRNWEKAITIKKPSTELRPILVHCQTTRADQLDKLKELGVIPTFFTSHTYYWGDVHLKNFGESRGSKVSNMRHAIDIGLTYTNHEDTPVVPPRVLFSIWSAVNRITRSGKIIGPDLRVTPYEALKAQTINGAYSYFEENNRGSLEVGKLADFVIMDKNLLKVDPMTIKDIKVLETIKEGKTIYKA